jgi:hypothetical protein
MNLYIWEGEDVLTDYTSGMICTIANSLDEAYDLNEPETYGDPRKGKSAYKAEPSRIISLNNTTKPEAFVCWGGG